jgi:hypothetical protein
MLKLQRTAQRLDDASGGHQRAQEETAAAERRALKPRPG